MLGADVFDGACRGRAMLQPSQGQSNRGGNYAPQGGMGYNQGPQQQWMGGMEQRSPHPGGMSEQAWIANGCPVPGPGGWTQYRTQEQEYYYHNAQSNETTWEKPPGWAQ